VQILLPVYLMPRPKLKEFPLEFCNADWAKKNYRGAKSLTIYVFVISPFLCSTVIEMLFCIRIASVSSLNPNDTQCGNHNNIPFAANQLSQFHLGFSVNFIIWDIILKYNNLGNHHYNVIFCWIPSHFGIKGST